MALPLNIDQYSAVIAPGASLSAAVPMGADTLVGIWMPATWQTAALTFQVSPDGGTTWLELYDSAGNEISFTAAANQYISSLTMPAYCWRGINMVKVRSGSAASPVTQTAGATITLIGRPEMF